MSDAAAAAPAAAPAVAAAAPAPAAAAAAAAAPPAATATAPAVAAAGRVVASPFAKKMAAEKGIDLRVRCHLFFCYFVCFHVIMSFWLLTAIA